MDFFVWAALIIVFSIISAIAKKKKQRQMMSGGRGVPVSRQAVDPGEAAVMKFLSAMGVNLPVEEESPFVEPLPAPKEPARKAEPETEEVKNRRSESLSEKREHREAAAAAARKTPSRDPLRLTVGLTPIQKAVVYQEVLGSPAGLRRTIFPREV